MSSVVWDTIDPDNTSGTELSNLLTDFKNAVMSGMSGTTRPTQTTAGGGWIDTSMAGSPNFYWAYKIYTGTIDVEVFRVSIQSGRAYMAQAESSFTVARYTADAIGPILKLMKERLADNGQTEVGDVLGEIQFIGADDANGNPIVCRIKAVATDDATVSESGGYLVFENTVDGSATLVEAMRLVDSKLGIGTTDPTHSLHVKGTGIKSEKESDDTAGAKVILRKKRITGTGAVQSGDTLGEVDFNTTDDTSTEATSAKIEAVSTEAHTTTEMGTKLSFKTASTDSAALTEKLSVGDVVEPIVPIKVNSLVENFQDIATTASITALNADSVGVNFTGSTPTTVHGIDSTKKSKSITLHNGSSAQVTLPHESATAAAGDRFKLPNSADLVLQPDTSYEFFKSTTDSRWKLKSGGGSGGGGAGAGVVTPGVFPYTVSDDDAGKTILVDTSTGATTIELFAADAGFTFSVKDIAGKASTNPITLERVASEEIEGLAANMLLESDNGKWEVIFDGTDWWVN